jgi:hypothetical protein
MNKEQGLMVLMRGMEVKLAKMYCVYSDEEVVGIMMMQQLQRVQRVMILFMHHVLGKIMNLFSFIRVRALSLLLPFFSTCNKGFVT